MVKHPGRATGDYVFFYVVASDILENLFTILLATITIYKNGYRIIIEDGVYINIYFKLIIVVE